MLNAYAFGVSSIQAAQDELSATLNSAYSLLNRPMPADSPLHNLLAVADGLAEDSADYERRSDFLIEADATLALTLGTRPGDLLNERLSKDAIENGWTYHESLLRAQLSKLRQLSTEAQIAKGREIRRLEEAIAIIEAPFSTTGRHGDLDADLSDVRIGHPLRIPPGPPTQRGRDLVIRALEDTANPDAINRDEFQAIIHDNGNLTLVLPGVIDLSSPNFGLDPDHRSTRDLDQNAWKSAQSALLADNKYGLRIRDWIQLMVDSGAIRERTPTSIIGHSYGGDTALDLAADQGVNGVLLNITHVYSAAYHNEPQLSSVPAHTQVIVAQNIYDSVVFLESVGATVDHLYTGDWDGLATGMPTTTRVTVETFEDSVNGIAWLIDKSLDVVEGAVQDVHGIEFNIPELPDIEVSSDRYAEVSENVMIVEFEGGRTGGGHSQDNYIDYLRSPIDERLAGFLSELDAAGFTADGTTVSIDVSEPDA